VEIQLFQLIILLLMRYCVAQQLLHLSFQRAMASGYMHIISNLIFGQVVYVLVTRKHLFNSDRIYSAAYPDHDGTICHICGRCN
jgi:hypothetical protein